MAATVAPLPVAPTGCATHHQAWLPRDVIKLPRPVRRKSARGRRRVVQRARRSVLGTPHPSARRSGRNGRLQRHRRLCASGTGHGARAGGQPGAGGVEKAVSDSSDTKKLCDTGPYRLKPLRGKLRPSAPQVRVLRGSAAAQRRAASSIRKVGPTAVKTDKQASKARQAAATGHYTPRAWRLPCHLPPGGLSGSPKSAFKRP